MELELVSVEKQATLRLEREREGGEREREGERVRRDKKKESFEEFGFKEETNKKKMVIRVIWPHVFHTFIL